MSISSSSSSPVKYWVSHEDGYIPNFYHSGFFYSTLFFGGSSKDKERKLVPTSQAFLALLSSRLIAAHDIRSLIVQRLHFCKRQEKSNFKKLKVETQSYKHTILQKKTSVTLLFGGHRVKICLNELLLSHVSCYN
jgi:hypothetical protein